MTTHGSEEPQTELVGRVLAGRYRIDELLGAGGMGAVYRAEHVHMRKAVAIKVLHQEMMHKPEVVARFEREAVAAARIEHPHVAAAKDFGRLDDGSFYLVLEFVEGRSLRALIKSEGGLSPVRALRIARQITEALSAAHAAGIVHRDLKPDNVMLVDKEGHRDFVKVLDFGIAKVKSEEAADQPALTQMGSVFGTPEYMAPEQAQGNPVDTRADLYTVGVLLYEMLAGRPPFQGNDLLVVLTLQMTAEPPPLADGVDARIQELVASLLKKVPEDRPQTAAELVQRIDGILSALDGTPSDSALSVDGSAPGSPSSTGPSWSGPLSRGPLPPPPRARAVSSAGLSSVKSLPSAPRVAGAVTGLGTSAAEPASPFRDTVLQRPATAPAGAGAARAGSRLRTTLSSRLTIGGQPIPMWAVLVTAFGGLFALGLIVTSLLLSGAQGSDQRQSVVPVQGRNESAELEQLMGRAKNGDREALAELAEHEAEERTAEQWYALGRGHSAISEFSVALSAYRAALKREPNLGTDRALLADVRAALRDPEVSSEALALAREELGEVGADLIYELSKASNPRLKPSSGAAKSLLETDALRKKASAALLVTLDLEAARGCTALKAVLPRAKAHADARSLPMLKKLGTNRGCGFLGLTDCYACLRGDAALEAALARASSEPGPSFALEPDAGANTGGDAG